MVMDCGQPIKKAQCENLGCISGQKTKRQEITQGTFSVLHKLLKMSFSRTLSRDSRNPVDAALEKHHLTFPCIFKGGNILIN